MCITKKGNNEIGFDEFRKNVIIQRKRAICTSIYPDENEQHRKVLPSILFAARLSSFAPFHFFTRLFFLRFIFPFSLGPRVDNRFSGEPLSGQLTT